MLKLANIPFTGASVLGSAIGMDKEVAKRLLRDAGISIPKFVAITRPTDASYKNIKKSLGSTVFVKPANLGSSVGITKVTNEAEFNEAVVTAFQYDSKIVVEECIMGREIEIAVLGNEDLIASMPGEVIPQNGFYSYEAKYIDEHGALLEIPAKLDKETIEEMQKIALKAFKALCCEGMGRVDFFLKNDGRILVNEINTIPGFTNISMYPTLWEISGISCGNLIDRLIELAIERNRKENNLKIGY